MQIIQEGKAGLLKSKPGYHYPNFRLPREFQNLIGEDYKVFTTSFKPAFPSTHNEAGGATPRS